MLAWSPTNAAQANENYTKYHLGVGVGVYWYMGGPGVDPHWNGTTTEAYNWGARQAAETLVDIKGRYIPYPVIWADIELPGIAPAPDNGWNSVYTSICSGHVRQAYVPAAVDRAEFNGFAAYITSHSTYKVGVYSAASIWNSIFGTGSTYASIPNTYEWTYLPATRNLSAAPNGWRLHRLVDVRPVLRRADVVEQVRPDVAVVGRRRLHQRARRLRPDRRRSHEVATTAFALRAARREPGPP